jgi:redox-sensitive bicupin YhaK (pirin superfamily)
VLPVHFVQMWVLPDTAGIDPGYEQADISAALEAGELIPVASGTEPGAGVRIHQRDATLWAARLPAGGTVTVPDGPFAHVFVVVGDVVLEGAGRLGAGDAARLTGAGRLTVTGGDTGAEVLVWVTGG